MTQCRLIILRPRTVRPSALQQVHWTTGSDRLVNGARSRNGGYSTRPKWHYVCWMRRAIGLSGARVVPHCAEQYCSLDEPVW